MKYCPNPECRHRIVTGNAAEFQDHVETCSDCGTVLEDPEAGPRSELSHPTLLTVLESLPRTDDLPWVTVAEFPSHHVAHAARISLASFSIDSEVHHGCNPWAAASRFVHLQVPVAAAGYAREILERREPLETGGEPSYDEVLEELDR